MDTRTRVAGAVVVALALGAVGFVVGSSYGDGGQARFAVEIAEMPGVQRVSLYGAEVSQVSFDRDVEVDEVLAVRDRFDDEGLDAGVDVAGVHGRWSDDLARTVPVMIAVAQVAVEPASVRVREVSDAVWVEARMVEGATVAEAGPVVLRVLRELAADGKPDDLAVVGANTQGKQLDLVYVGPEALARLDETVASFAAVVEGGRPGKIECDAAGCRNLPADDA